MHQLRLEDEKTYVSGHMEKYFTNLGFPEVRGFAETLAAFWGDNLVWGRYNLTRCMIFECYHVVKLWYEIQRTCIYPTGQCMSCHKPQGTSLLMWCRTERNFSVSYQQCSIAISIFEELFVYVWYLLVTRDRMLLNSFLMPRPKADCSNDPLLHSSLVSSFSKSDSLGGDNNDLMVSKFHSVCNCK